MVLLYPNPTPHNLSYPIPPYPDFISDPYKFNKDNSIIEFFRNQYSISNLCNQKAVKIIEYKKDCSPLLEKINYLTCNQ
jgi:hypothetical protein